VLSMLVGATDETGDKLTDGELRDELITLLLAGHETTATGLAWAVERLVRHPEQLARLRDGDDAYLDAVVKETLRVRPVVNEVGRDLTEPVELGGHALPAGTRVMSSIGLVQHAQDNFADPARFRPERFLNGDSPAPYTWIPFGGGRRRCIGASFAMLEMQIVIRTVLTHRELQPTQDGAEHASRRNIAVRPARGAVTALGERRPAAVAAG